MSHGKLRHKAAGTATITATDGAYSTTLADTVSAAAGATVGPKFTLPSGWVYQNGGFVRTEVAWNTLPGETGATLDPTAYTTARTLVNSGSRTTNQSNLQTEINNAYARAGNTIIYLDGSEWLDLTLTAGIYYGVNAINVPAPTAPNDGTTWVVVADKRLDPAKAVAFPRASMKRVQSGDETAMPSFSIGLAPGTGGLRPFSAFSLAVGARRFATVGCHFRYDSTFAPPMNNSNPGLNEGFFQVPASSSLTSAASYPSYIVVDRCVAHGEHNVAMTRPFHIQGHYVALTNDRVYDVGTPYGDSQCFTSQTGAGPYLIQNNYLGCGWGENVMFGGGSCLYDTEVPSDIAFVGNTVDQQYHTTDTVPYDHKNLFELKVGRRVLVTGNRFTSYVGTGQYGSQWYVLTLKAISQDNGDYTTVTGIKAWWDLTHDVTVWGNLVLDSAEWLQLTDASQGYGSLEFHRMEVAHNIVRAPTTALNNTQNYAVLIGGESSGPGADPANQEPFRSRDVLLHHNTAFGPSKTGAPYTHFMQHAADINTAQASPWTRWTVQDNVFDQPASTGSPGAYLSAQSGSFSSATYNFTGLTKLNVVWGHNAVLRANPSTEIVGDTAYADETAAGLNSDGSLVAGSPLLTGASDGGAQGANTTYVNSATAKAATGL